MIDGQENKLVFMLTQQKLGACAMGGSKISIA